MLDIVLMRLFSTAIIELEYVFAPIEAASFVVRRSPRKAQQDYKSGC